MSGIFVYLTSGLIRTGGKRDYKQNVYISNETQPFIRCHFIHKQTVYDIDSVHISGENRLMFCAAIFYVFNFHLFQ